MEDAPNFDELQNAGPEHLDPAYVAGYDRKAQVNVADDIALMRERGLDGSSVLVDLGAGTGVLALAAARFCRRVVAVDVSPSMLEVLRRKLAASDLANVECVQAGFLTYQTRQETIDFVYSRNALHHLPDFWKAVALDRIAKMLKPGRYLRLRDLIYSFVPARANEVFGAWLGQASRDP